MVGIEELERHYREDDFHTIPPHEFVTAAQIFLGLSPQAHPDPEEYDALVDAEGEPSGTVEQRQAAGHFVDALAAYVQSGTPDDDTRALTGEDVRAWHQAELEQAQQARKADPDIAHLYPEYSLDHAYAATQKRQTWLTGVLLHELDDNYPNATTIKPAIEAQRGVYRLVEGVLGEAIEQERHENLAAELAAAEQRVRERGPVHYLVYRALAWSLPRIPQLINAALAPQPPPADRQMVQ
jgi:hypothetical protein